MSEDYAQLINESTGHSLGYQGADEWGERAQELLDRLASALESCMGRESELNTCVQRHLEASQFDARVNRHDELVARAEKAEARVAELEGDKTAGLDMIRDRLDADPSTVAEAVEGLIGLYKIEFDQRVELEGEITELHGVGKRRTAAHADLQAQLESSRAEVERLSKAARAVCFSPTAGETIVYVKSSALQALDALIRDERKEGE